MMKWLKCTLAAGLALTFSLSPAWAAPAAEVKAETKTEKKEEAPKIQIAILLDTSGSMSGLINQARTKLWKIVNEFATAKQEGKSPNLEVALYEYGKQTIPQGENYLRQILPLTDDLDNVSKELFGLKTNGGEEYCGAVIKSAVTGLKWSDRNDDLKIIFVCGNESFNQGNVSAKDACKEAIEKGILVNTIFCGPEADGVKIGWKQGADWADGSYAFINQNRQVVAIVAPQDKKLVELNAKINKTYLAYGKKEKRDARMANQKMQDSNAAQAGGRGGEAERAVAKASSLYRNSTWDLVDGLAEKKIKLEDLKDEQLPEEMKKMSVKERKEFITKKAQEREDIKKEIQKLNDERKKYVAAERKRLAEEQGKKANSLDEAIINAVRTQAKAKNYKLDDGK